MENTFNGLLDEELVSDDESNSSDEITLIQVMAGIVGLSEIISVLSTKIDALVGTKEEAVEAKEEVVETVEEEKKDEVE